MNKFKSKKYGQLYGGDVINWRKKKRLEKKHKKIKMNDFKNFMRWLWNNYRETYTLIMLGHTELITKELMDKYRAESEET